MSINKQSWSKKIAEVEIFLQAQPKNVLLSYERDDISKPSTPAGGCTRFTLEWDYNLFYGPRTMLVEVPYWTQEQHFIQTDEYFTPNEEEKMELERARLEWIAKGGDEDDWIFMRQSRFDEPAYHETIQELYAAMVDENARYQAQRD